MSMRVFMSPALAMKKEAYADISVSCLEEGVCYILAEDEDRWSSADQRLCNAFPQPFIYYDEH